MRTAGGHKRYYVVEFLEDHSTYVVSENWIRRDGGSTWCFWPPCVSKLELTKILEKKVPVEESWRKYAARILATKKSLRRAQESLPYAEVTSNLDTDSSGAQKRSRHKRRRHVSTSDESSSEQNVAMRESKYIECNTKFQQKHSDNGKLCCATPRITTLPQNRTTGCHDVQNVDNYNTSRETVPEPDLHDDPSRPHFHSDTAMAEPVGSPATLQPVAMPALNYGVSQDCTFASLQKQIRDLTSQHLENTEELLHLEEYAAFPENSEILVQYFTRFGGTDLQDSVRTLLRQIISKRTALQFSWKGSRGKNEAFEKLSNVLNIILMSVRSRFPDASLASVGQYDHGSYR
ncbi:hypothetical protein MTO96_011510 [Rhipicephalus appendiculatus]